MEGRQHAKVAWADVGSKGDAVEKVVHAFDLRPGSGLDNFNRTGISRHGFCSSSHQDPMVAHI
jgi:hypothetical protein